MKEYFFKVVMNDADGTRRIGKRKDSSCETTITMKNDNLKVSVSRKNGNLNRKFNSFSEGENEIKISDIVSVKYKLGYAISFSFPHILYFLLILTFLILDFYYIWTIFITPIILLRSVIVSLLFSIIFFLVLIPLLTVKCIQMDLKEEDVIRNKKYNRIVFPISNVLWKNSLREEQNKANLFIFINEIMRINSNIKYKEDKIKKNFIKAVISIIIIIPLISLPLKQYMVNKPNEFEEEKSNITTNSIYTEEEIDDDYVLSDSKIVNYDSKRTEIYRFMYKIVDNYEYVYMGKKKFKLGMLTNKENIANNVALCSYYKEKQPELYNFIHCEDSRLENSYGIKMPIIKIHNYTSIEKIHEYKCEYGECYIIKATNNKKEIIDYLLYVENENKTNLNELDGLLLNSCIDRDGNFDTEGKAIESFKSVVEEK